MGCSHISAVRIRRRSGSHIQALPVARSPGFYSGAGAEVDQGPALPLANEAGETMAKNGNGVVTFSGGTRQNHFEAQWAFTSANPAGGGTDITARVIAQWLSERLGQSFVVENRPGGGTNIGTEAAAKSPPDGYTLLMVGASNTVNPTLYDKLNFDLIRDFAPIAGVIRAPQIVVANPVLPLRTLPEFIAYAKSNPSKVNMASSGNGSAAHLAGELFKMLAGVICSTCPIAVVGRRCLI